MTKLKLVLIGCSLLALGACANTGNEAADAVIGMVPSIVLRSVF